MDTVVAGIRSTGNLHLGNYFGALKNFLSMQKEYNCFFFIADYHALTTHTNSKELSNNVKTVLAEYIGAGVNYEECTIYTQSSLPQTAELYLLLNMHSYLGELERCASFKEKVRKSPNNVNAGLLTYPVLMSADILIHHGTKVPVGKDQEQHLEMTRQFSNRFNNIYGVDYFKEAFAFNYGEQLVKIPGLDGQGKMGKSEGEGNAVFLCDSDDIIRKKVMRAVSDSGPTEPNQPKPIAIDNLFSLMSYVSEQSTIEHFNTLYNSCNIRYGDMKKQLAEDIIKTISPIRSRIEDVSKNHDFLKKVAEIGKEKAHESANKTIKEVRDIIGLNHF